MSYTAVLFLAIIPFVILFWSIIRLFMLDWAGIAITIIIGLVCIMFLTWGIVFWNRVTYFEVYQWLIVAGPFALAINFGVEFLYQVKEKDIPPVKWILGISVIGIVLFQVAVLPFIATIPVTMGEARWVAEETETHFDVFPFVNDPIDSSIRMVTKEYALKRAYLFDGPFGSNVQQESANIIRVNGTLYWSVTYKRDRLLGSNGLFQENRIVGAILIDVNDPNAQAIIIETENLNYANNLWYNHKIDTVMYRRDQSYKYQRSYLTINDFGLWVIVVTKWTQSGPFKPSIFGPVVILDASNGKLIRSYDVDDFASTPLWVTQVYPEDWLEKVINNWGRKRDLRNPTGVDFWASSVIHGRSNHRIKMSEDTRYIINPDTGDSVAYVAMNLKGFSGSLSGIFVASKGKFDYYDLVDQGFVSTTIALQALMGKSDIVARPHGNYKSAMPIAYALNTSTGLRLVWYVPIYYSYSDTLEVAYFGIIDAKDTSKYAIVSAEGKDGEQMVYEARIKYKTLFETQSTETYEYAQVTNINSYVIDGETIFVLQLNDSRIIRASKAFLNETEWNEIVLTSIGDTIKFQQMIDDDDIIWFITFDNLDITT